MKNKKIKDVIKKVIKESPFINSFKLDKRFWHVLLLNLIFIILFLSLIPLYTFILRSNLDMMKQLDDSAMRIREVIEGRGELDSTTLQDFKLASSSLKFFFLKMAVISIVFLVVLLLIIGYFTARMWSKITKEKFDKRMVFKISLLVFVWNLFWVLLFLFIVFGLKFEVDTIKVIAIVEFFIYIYFSLIIAPIFFRSKKMMRSVKETFLIGAIKFYAFLPAILAIWLTSSIMFILVINISFRLPGISLIISIPLALLYITWMKFYINAVIDKIYHLG